eukprot:CAMPEP_0197004178 /NCGR_PEP_ID=MMETSP1380-20130617/19753_1 /TAXON_ID=5936 /ORGANISM="Euplotes crassus, Strain CT5" /LENGTH=162 /DNA_ID=CAMNT_0042422885 /DNA_START=75 /DNA_END=563 /DNA_ORIENTATION=+
MDEVPEQTAKVMNLFYFFQGYIKEHEVLNYQQKIQSGMIQIPYTLVHFRLDKLTDERVSKVEESLAGVDVESLKSENDTAHNIFLWMKATIKAFHEGGESESDSDKEEAKIMVKAKSHVPHPLLKLTKARRTPVAPLCKIKSTVVKEEGKDIGDQIDTTKSH